MQQSALSSISSESGVGQRLLRPGLHFHFGSQTATEDRQRYGTLSDVVKLVVLLEGVLDLRFGSRRVRLDAGRVPQMALMRLDAPQDFARVTHKGEYSRRLSLGVSQEWLAQAMPLAGLSGQAVQVLHWPASRRACVLAEQMLQPPALAPEMAGMYLECRAIELLMEALAGSKLATSASPPEGMRAAAYRRICDLRAWLQANAARPLSMEQIAAQGHTSVATLQRHFRQAYGISVSEFIQRTRLEQARAALEQEGISVTAAGAQAGYANPASFSTAFKRHFGVSPRQLQARIQVSR